MFVVVEGNAEPLFIGGVRHGGEGGRGGQQGSSAWPLMAWGRLRCLGAAWMRRRGDGEAMGHAGKDVQVVGGARGVQRPGSSGSMNR